MFSCMNFPGLKYYAFPCFFCLFVGIVGIVVPWFLHVVTFLIEELSVKRTNQVFENKIIALIAEAHHRICLV